MVVDVYAQRSQFSSRLSDGVISIRMSTENYKSAPIGFTMSLCLSLQLHLTTRNDNTACHELI
jgi:hypothetical protein